MLVYIINKYGKLLMPCSAKKVHVLLKIGKAIVIRKLDGTRISAGISYKKLVLISRRKTYLVERRERLLAIKAGVSATHI